MGDKAALASDRKALQFDERTAKNRPDHLPDLLAKVSAMVASAVPD
jgi:hypothetical protein